MKKNYADPNKEWVLTMKLPRFIWNVKAVALFLIAFFNLGNFSESKAQSGIYESYAILKRNGGGDALYDMQETTGNPDFQGANQGTFYSGNTFILNGAEDKVYNSTNLLFKLDKAIIFILKDIEI